MKWKNIKKAGLTTEVIAKRLRYSNANSFRNSSKYKLIMDLLDEVAGKTETIESADPYHGMNPFPMDFGE